MKSTSDRGSNVTVRNIITSMRRFGSRMDGLLREVSLVDDVLQRGSAFATWTSPHAISIAAPSNNSRGARTTRKSRLCAGHRSAGGIPDARYRRRTDPGYYLIIGPRAFETAIGFRPPCERLPGRDQTARRRSLYGTIGWLTAGSSPCLSLILAGGESLAASCVLGFSVSFRRWMPRSQS